ncbi:hypothetical protein KSS87_014421 [Heliosperma pusillum]|nr:hypothetical protein KSS87_014421 [Heliosperma pusillum]
MIVSILQARLRKGFGPLLLWVRGAYAQRWQFMRCNGGLCYLAPLIYLLRSFRKSVSAPCYCHSEACLYRRFRETGYVVVAVQSSLWLMGIALIALDLKGYSHNQASMHIKIVAGIVTNVVSTLFKWLWSLSTTTIKAEKGVSTRSMIKYEAGYTVETVFDGSKAGIEPYSVVASPTGELLLLDSANSNLYKVSAPLSRYSRHKIMVGSAEGYTGHVDGKLREARMYHPKGITVDDNGNIYVADTFNLAIRKITDSGITTIAGGKRSHGGGHTDGASEDTKFSDDFDIVYVRSSCSLLVTDRGNQVIREIQLHDTDCTYEHPIQLEEGEEESLHLGVAVLVAAVFCGYMLALLKQRVQALFSTNKDSREQFRNHTLTAPYQRPLNSVRQPLIPQEDEDECEDNEDEGLLFSFGRLIVNASSSVAEVFAGLIFSGFRKKRGRHQNLRHFHQINRHANHGWPMKDGYFIRNEDERPELEIPTPTMRKVQQKTRQSQTFYDAQDDKSSQHQGTIPQEEEEHHKQRQGSAKAKTKREKSPDKSEIVFGAVQEQDGRREAMVIKAVDYSDPAYAQHNVRHNVFPRLNYMGYSSYSYG